MIWRKKGDSDSVIGRKKSPKKNPGAKRLDKVTSFVLDYLQVLKVLSHVDLLT